MNEKIQDLIDEIDGLVEKINQSDDEPSQEVLDTIEELTKEIDLLKEKKQIDYSKELSAKLDQLIQSVVDGDKLSTETTKGIVEAISKIKIDVPQVTVEAPKVSVNIPEVKAPIVNVPETKLPEPKVYFPDEMAIKKPSWIENLIDLSPILNGLKAIFDIVGAFKLPKDAKDAIPVRLSDGEKFYKSIGGISSAISGAFPFKKSDSSDMAALVDTDGTQYTYIRETLPIAPTKVNASVELGMNAGGTLVRIRKTINGVIYEKTLSDVDMTVTSTKTISTWSVV